MTASLPSHAEIVVIGGGIIGCSTAYHLARDHGADVVVLEQNQLTSGSTWHAAGLVGQLRSSASITQLLKYSVELYEPPRSRDRARHRMEDDRLPQARLQCRPLDRVQAPGHHGAELRHGHAAAVARRGQGHVAADDGRRSRRRQLPAERRPGEPLRYRPGAGQGGAPAWRGLHEGVRVDGFDIADRPGAGGPHRPRRHRLRQGGELRRSVGAPGRRAGRRQRAAAAGEASVCDHRADPGLARDIATVRDPDRRTYFKEEVGGLVMGGYEPDPDPGRSIGVRRPISPSSCSTTTGSISSST